MIKDLYFNWLCDLVNGTRFSRQRSYRKLLRQLDSIDFVWTLPMDENRAEKGAGLRRRYILENGYTSYDEYDAMMYELDRPCSVLEMMIALALDCEEHIMDDPAMGNRTGQWFWGMIVSLGLGAMNDANYDPEYVDDVISRFLYREYEPNGRGGLFTIKNCDRDLRDVEIWTQLSWYLGTII